MVFNSLAVANMQMGNFEDAEKNLQDSLAKVTSKRHLKPPPSLHS